MSRRTIATQNKKGAATPSIPSLVSLHDVLSVGMNHGKGPASPKAKSEAAPQASGESQAMMRYKTFFYLSTLKGFLEMVKDNDPRLLTIPKQWEDIFNVATTWSPEPGRANDWRWHLENFRKGLADAFIESVKKEADTIRAANSDPSKVEELNKKLSIHFRNSLERVVMHKMMFGGDYVDIDKLYSYENSVPPMGSYFFAQVVTFLSRANGSIPALIRIVNEWKKKLPSEYVRMIPSRFMANVFREAVRIAYRPDYKFYMDNVDRAAAAIEASWDGRLNKRARIELGFEDGELDDIGDLDVQF